MSDALTDGSSFRTLNIDLICVQHRLDEYNREYLAIEPDTAHVAGVDFLLPALRVICVLERSIETYGKPEKLRCDNGSISALMNLLVAN